MEPTHPLTQIGTGHLRQTALGLLAAAAVTVAVIAMPLAGTASAGGLSGGVIQRNDVAAPGATTGSKPGGAGNEIQIAGGALETGTSYQATPDTNPSTPDDTVHTAGSKRGVAATQG